MAARACRYLHQPPHSLLILLACCLRAEGFIKEENVLRDVRQVACQHPADGLVALMLREEEDTTRTVVANTLRNSCIGNLSFHGCYINQTVVEVKVIITDLQEGQVRTFTCLASTQSVTGTETRILGPVNVTKTGESSDNKSTSTVSLDRRSDKQQSPNISQEECAGDLTAGLTVLIVLTVIFCVISIALFGLYLTVRNKMPSTKATFLEINEVKDQKVKASNQYQSTRSPPPVVQAAAVPVERLVMKYQIPDNLSSGGPLAQATADGTQGQGSLQYQQPWAQLDDEISDRLAALRPNPRMCLVPGFQRPADVTQTSHDLKEEAE